MVKLLQNLYSISYLIIIQRPVVSLANYLSVVVHFVRPQATSKYIEIRSVKAIIAGQTLHLQYFGFAKLQLSSAQLSSITNAE